VRSDGESLFAGKGMVAVPEMGQILHQSLSQSGRYFSDQELSRLIETAQKMAALRDDGETAKSISLLRKVSKLGPPGEIPSYAQPAQELNALVNEMVLEGRSRLTPIEESLTDAKNFDEAQKLKLISDFLEVSDQYQGLKPLRADFSRVKKAIRSEDDFRELQKGLETIRKTESAKSRTSIERAMEKVQEIVDQRKSGALVDQASKAIESLKKRLAEIEG
jgi:predicted nucleotidyltransferase